MEWEAKVKIKELLSLKVHPFTLKCLNGITHCELGAFYADGSHTCFGAASKGNVRPCTYN